MKQDPRIPLSSLIGLASALGATELTPAQRDLVELIRLSGQSLERMVEDMLHAGGGHRQPAPAGRARILVVDDEVFNRAAVELMLEPLAADIVEAENGEEAVSLYADQDFDLVIIDVEMPRLDGLSAVRAMRYLERWQGRARAPIVMLTARSRPEDESASMAAGADLHLIKPVTPQRLLATAEKILAPLAAARR